MKKCDYCGKEISYMEQYCSEDCQKKTIEYYEYQEKYTKIFSIINCICIFAIPVGLFILPLSNILGLTMIALALDFLGITVFFLPFPTENMISKFKLKKATDICRIIGIILFVIGIIVSIVDIVMFFI